MEWVACFVLLINLLLINTWLSTATPLTAEIESFEDGFCMIRSTTIASTVNRPADCKQMLLSFVNVTNPSQEVFDSIADGLDLLRISDSHIRSVYLPPNLLSLDIHRSDSGQLVIDRKFTYKLQDLELTNLLRLPVNLASLQSLKKVNFIGRHEAKIDFTIFSKLVQLEEITLDSFGNLTTSNSLQMPSLRRLQIWRCVPKTSLEFPSLENLDQHSNSLQTISQYVSENQLGRILLDDFANLTHLELLTFEYCEISELSTRSIVHLPALKFFHLNHNKLTQLNVELWHMPKLTELSLGYNQLKQITGEAQLLTVKAFTLILHHNPCDCQWITATREQFPEANVVASKPCSRQATFISNGEPVAVMLRHVPVSVNSGKLPKTPFRPFP